MTGEATPDNRPDAPVSMRPVPVDPPGDGRPAAVEFRGVTKIYNEGTSREAVASGPCMPH